jgi:hypothetical protein
VALVDSVVYQALADSVVLVDLVGCLVRLLLQDLVDLAEQADLVVI